MIPAQTNNQVLGSHARVRRTSRAYTTTLQHTDTPFVVHHSLTRLLAYSLTRLLAYSLTRSPTQTSSPSSWVTLTTSVPSWAA